MYINDLDIEDIFGGVFLFRHWTSFFDCPRSVNEPPPFIAVPHNLHGLPQIGMSPIGGWQLYLGLP